MLNNFNGDEAKAKEAYCGLEVRGHYSLTWANE